MIYPDIIIYEFLEGSDDVYIDIQRYKAYSLDLDKIITRDIINQTGVSGLKFLTTYLITKQTFSKHFNLETWKNEMLTDWDNYHNLNCEEYYSLLRFLIEDMQYQFDLQKELQWSINNKYYWAFGEILSYLCENGGIPIETDDFWLNFNMSYGYKKYLKKHNILSSTGIINDLQTLIYNYI